ncbi:PTS sugar transporter subunit IIC [Streptococcus gordonii]|uniref:PTS sugar transporter subunit IIC n=1 Tax=Streptococcus gordonii TaxID=1302 RepID=UPI001CBC3FD3|nr:PTS transporter subunit EIIC [Streptococcus gordonii]MBZ2133874.1 PTS transporter subunit EIIC [Streptococcus gordonii]MBZ2142342.1 PTS transporter subunit EIIC [Streptococcus gordonii]MBZ2144156.1 PTS transporter subunit EIIC [Streptococcus gordonii]MBZ2146261.1 PTS transporter subunit EIIC [Streptococcus gordonii]
MSSLMDKWQARLMPIANKVGNQKFLVALRDSFIGTMPVIMTGSFALMLNAFLADLPGQFGWTWITTTFQWLIDINWLVFKGSIPIVVLLFLFTFGVNIARIYNTDKVSAGLVAVASYVITIGGSISKTFELASDSQAVKKAVEKLPEFKLTGNSLAVTLNGVIPGDQISARGYFTAILIGFVSVIIFCKVMNRNWTIKLPDSVPPAIMKPFLSIIPAAIAMYVVGITTYIFNTVTGDLMINWIYKVLQAPLLSMSQSFWAVLLIVFLNKIFWFFGLHGGNVLAPVMASLFGVTMLANLEAFQAGQTIPYMWTDNSFGAFVWFDAIGVAIAILWQAKNKHYREVAKLGIFPMIFNIGEPVMYGLPIVLNPIMFIPYVLTPLLMVTVSYWATAWGLVAPVTQNVTWVMPPVLYGFFATAFDWRAIVLSLINIAISTFVYLPFVKMADKQQEL